MNAMMKVGVLAGAEAAGRLIAFSLTAVIARAYGLDDLAMLAVAQALIAYATIGGDAGLNQEATRRLVAGEQREVVTRDAVRAQCASTLLATVVVMLVVAAYEPKYVATILFFLPVPFAYAVSTPYLLDSVGRIVPIAVGRVLMSLGAAVSGLLLISLGVSGMAFGAAYSIGAWMATGWILWRAHAPVRCALTAMGREARVARLRSFRQLGSLAVLLHTQASLPVLVAGRFSEADDLESVGVVTRLWFVLSAPLAMSLTVLLPLFARTADRGPLWRAVSASALYGAATAGVFHFLAPDLLVILFGSPAGAASPAAVVFMYAIIPFALISVGNAFLIANYRERSLAVCYGLSLLAFGLILIQFQEASDLAIAWAWVGAQGVLLVSASVSAVEVLRSGRAPNTTTVREVAE